VRETCRYVKGKFLGTGRAIARDDAIVSPLHHAGTELMAELRRIDQQERRPHALRFPRKQGKRRFERSVGHRARQPSQLQDPVRLVMADFPPGIASQRGAHCAPPFPYPRDRGALARLGSRSWILFATASSLPAPSQNASS